MKQYLRNSALALCLISGIGLASALFAPQTALADESAGESRSIDANVTKIYLDGAAALELHQGPTASIQVYGSKEDLESLNTRQLGDTFHIDTDGFFVRTPRLRIDITLPNLSQFTSTGVGPAHITGFSGDRLQLSVTGAGNVNVNAHYKHLAIRSTGVASMNVDGGESDSVDLSSPGAGHIVLIGQTRDFISHLDGVGGVDAKDLKADNVVTYLNGFGSVKVYAKKEANVYLHGFGSVTVYGTSSTRHASVTGFGKINWE